MDKFKKKIDLRDPKYRVPIAIVVLTILAVVMWYMQVYTPQMDQITSLQKRFNEKQDTLRTIQALKPQLNLLKSELDAAQVKLDSLKSIFPDQKEIPKLIREITSVANASGITTTKFNPMQDVEKEYYVENHYMISIIGGYHQLAEFYAFLANFPLIINLSGVNIASNPDFSSDYRNENEEVANPPTIVSQFEMTTFSSKK
jgi:type IV pilus assembly protein PilO